MTSWLNLFTCETPSGNRSYEHKFQSWITDDSWKEIAQADLDNLVARARGSIRDREAVTALAKLLDKSLSREAYRVFLNTFSPLTYIIFYERTIVFSNGSTDFERTDALHYPKYTLFKFASFLDLLNPGHLHWRGQADQNSMRWASIGLRKFQEADLSGRESLLVRWLSQPGAGAFSEKRSRASSEMHKRNMYLLSLSNRVNARLVAQHLDEKVPKRSGTKYGSYGEWYEKNPKSFESWLSKQRKDALNSLPFDEPS